MNGEETYRDTLRYALAIAGSKRALATRLNVELRLLESWLSGARQVPEEAFHAALDLVIHASPQAISRSRERLQRLTG